MCPSALTEDRTLIATADILDEAPDRITILCDYRLKDQVKAVPGARWNTVTRHWTVPLSWTACLAMRAEFGKGLVIGETLRAWAKAVGVTKGELNAMRPSMGPALDGEGIVPGWDALYDYQQVDAVAIYTAEKYLLLNEVGTGKSRSALAGLSLIQHHNGDAFPVLIAAPKSMLRTWEREIMPFFPAASVSIIDGTPTKVHKALEPGFDFYIIAWDSLRKYSRLAGYGSTSLTAEEKMPKELNALGFNTVILDECHRSKNPTAKRTRAAWFLAHECNYRIGLTGSSIQDTVEDLYGLLHGLFPDEYPTKSSYVERWCLQEWNTWGGRDIVGIRPDRADEFYTNFNACTRRITKEVALPFLPPCVEEIRWVTLAPKARKAYNAMRDTFMAELTDGSIVASENQLVRAGRLIQMANAELSAIPDEDGSFEIPADAHSDKVDQFITDLTEGDFGEAAIVVFSDLLGVLDIVQERLLKAKIEFVRIDGSVTGIDRQAAMDTFQDGKAKICLLTRAGGEGITLTAASVMVRLVRSWSYTVHQQVAARVHRIGSEVHESILYVDYITEDTLEEGVVVRLNAKEARATEALTAGELRSLLDVRLVS